MAMQAFVLSALHHRGGGEGVISLGPEELISMALDQGHAEIVCHYCNHATDLKSRRCV